MKKLQLSLCAIGAYLVLIGAFTIFGSPATGQGAGLPPGPDVRVINRASEPVPVTGQINIGSLPAVQLDTNGPLPVTDSDNPARQPVQFYLHSNPVSGPTTYEVPAGKRLVIEHISGNAYSSRNVLWIEVSTTAGGQGLSHLLPVTKAGLAGNQVDTVFVFAHETRLYADASTSVRAGHDAHSSGEVTRYVAISG